MYYPQSVAHHSEPDRVLQRVVISCERLSCVERRVDIYLLILPRYLSANSGICANARSASYESPAISKLSRGDISLISPTVSVSYRSRTSVTRGSWRSTHS